MKIDDTHVKIWHMCVVDHENFFHGNFVFWANPRIMKYRNHENLELYGSKQLLTMKSLEVIGFTVFNPSHYVKV